jgi:hypothetical protein
VSAFVVGKSVIDKAVWLFGQTRHFRRRLWRVQEEADDLGRKLWAMNTDAVAQRYQEEPEEVEEFRYSGKGYSICVALKAAHCLCYQCTEGDVPDTNPFYSRLTELCEEFAAYKRSPEYEEAPWGD